MAVFEVAAVLLSDCLTMSTTSNCQGWLYNTILHSALKIMMQSWLYETVVEKLRERKKIVPKNLRISGDAL